MTGWEAQQLTYYKKREQQIKTDIDHLNHRLSKSLCDVESAKLKDTKRMLVDERLTYLNHIERIEKNPL